VAWTGRTSSAASLAFAALILGWTGASAAPAPVQPTAADTVAAQIPQPPSPGAAADQIAQPPAAAVQTGQLSVPSTGQTSAEQLSTTMASAAAPPALSTPAEGRNAQTAPIHGHDRCDPAAGSSAVQPACAHILDGTAGQFSAPTTETARTANPDAPASALVNDIVGGGTGSVVIAPAPGK
jgi:hypothetical protein